MPATILKAYADESGIHRGSERCLVAGYLASPQQWRQFSQEWAAQLNSSWPTFHSTKFFSRRGRPLPPDEVTGFLDGLLEIISRHRLYPFGSEVLMRDFWALSYGERRYVTGAGILNGRLHGGAPNSPYHLCFIHALNKVARMVRPGKFVEFVFDLQNEYSPLALDHFTQAKEALDKHYQRVLLGCSFVSKESLPPLQAVDLLAHCLYKRSDESNPLRNRALAACARGGFQLEIYDSRSFEILLGMRSADERARLKSLTEP